VTLTPGEPRRTSKLALGSRYGRFWTTTACLAGAAWIAVAVTQSPLGPLSLFALCLSFYGGLLAASLLRASAVSTMRRFVNGMLGTGAVVLVMVGIAHHVAAGLASAAALVATSPALFRRILRQ
jgi:hypothetical protein